MKPAQYKQPLTGLIWEAEIGSVNAVPLNQELMIMPPEVPFSHGGWMRLTDPVLVESTWIPLTINIPAFEDENGNGLHDFFEVSQAVGPISTTGVVAPVDGDEGALCAKLIQHANVTTLPGSFLARDAGRGNPGAHRLRIALVAEFDECLTAARRIVDVMKSI